MMDPILQVKNIKKSFDGTGVLRPAGSGAG